MSHETNGKRSNSPPSLTRRQLIERGAAAAALFALPGSALGTRSAVASHAATATLGERPYLEAAQRAERWIARAAVRDARGTAWPADPANPSSVETNLYSGTPGVALFYLELHEATGDKRYLEAAKGGADYLARSIPSNTSALGEEGAGLYTGLAGIAYTLSIVGHATRDARYAKAGRDAFALVRSAAHDAGAGVAWNPSTDIISGNAGIALALLWASHFAGERAPDALAVKAGRHLIERGVQEKGGLKWGIADSVPRRYPNFSHGTAGVSYVLATLYGQTKERTFLDAALAGHRYLQAIATTTPNDGLRVFHSEPGGEQLFYLSWCHGPAGTARLYRRLAEVTGDASYRAFIPKFAQGIVDSGVPETHPDKSGYWNNISQCCGNCGVSEFFLDLHRATGEQRYLDFATRVVQNTLARATQDGDGLKWIQAENRVSPEQVVAQTGLMQGAAGVGLALLHLDGALERRTALVMLPDNPW